MAKDTQTSGRAKLVPTPSQFDLTAHLQNQQKPKATPLFDVLSPAGTLGEGAAEYFSTREINLTGGLAPQNPDNTRQTPALTFYTNHVGPQVPSLLAYLEPIVSKYWKEYISRNHDDVRNILTHQIMHTLLTTISVMPKQGTTTQPGALLTTAITQYFSDTIAHYIKEFCKHNKSVKVTDIHSLQPLDVKDDGRIDDTFGAFEGDYHKTLQSQLLKQLSHIYKYHKHLDGDKTVIAQFVFYNPYKEDYFRYFMEHGTGAGYTVKPRSFAASSSTDTAAPSTGVALVPQRAAPPPPASVKATNIPAAVPGQLSAIKETDAARTRSDSAPVALSTAKKLETELTSNSSPALPAAHAGKGPPPPIPKKPAHLNIGPKKIAVSPKQPAQPYGAGPSTPPPVTPPPALPSVTQANTTITNILTYNQQPSALAHLRRGPAQSFGAYAKTPPAQTPKQTAPGAAKQWGPQIVKEQQATSSTLQTPPAF